MRKKNIVVGIVVIIVLIGAALAYLSYRNRSLSPAGRESLTIGDLTVSVNYSRPSVRGRLIFGTEEQKALLPHGKYWRLGANEATDITFSTDVLVNNEPIKAGTYSMYAYPGAENFEIRLNSDVGRWGVFEPDHSKDILSTKVPVSRTASPVEKYTISLVPQSDGLSVVFEWSDTRFSLPVKKQ